MEEQNVFTKYQVLFTWRGNNDISYIFHVMWWSGGQSSGNRRYVKAEPEQ